MQEKSERYIPGDVEGLGEATPEEVQARLIPQNYFTPSTRAKHPQGVLYQGEFETPSDGTARAVRLHALALASTGIPLLLRSISNVVVKDGVAEPVFIAKMPAEVGAEVGHLLDTDISAFRPVIKHVVIRSAEHLRQLIMPKGAVPKDPSDIQQQIAMRDRLYGNTIVYSVWERDRIDLAIAKHLARVKQCWVPCQQNARMLVSAGVPESQVHVVPHPYVEDGSFANHRRRTPAIFRGQKRFYSIGRWEPRKNFAQLVQAFMMAFKPEDGATLTIKYSGNGQWPGYPPADHVQKVADSFGYRDRVKLIGGTVDKLDIQRLHFDGNIYVSASHGEAWALPAFDAKLAGNRLVYVPWGGICDFASDDDLPVPHTMGIADPSYRWEHGAQWADPGLEDLTEALRRVLVPDRFELPARLGERFGLTAVGQKMRDLVDVATSGKS